MNTTTTSEDKVALRDAAKNESFARFLEDPMTKLAVSMIPPADNPDVFKMLLQSAFEAGYSHGSGSVLSSFLEVMLKKDEKRT